MIVQKKCIKIYKEIVCIFKMINGVIKKPRVGILWVFLGNKTIKN